MSLYDSDRRYRRRFWCNLLRFIIYTGLLIVVALGAYQWGIEDLDTRVLGYQQEIYTLEAGREGLEQDNVNLRTVAAKATAAYRELKARYEEDVPKGEHKALYDQLKQKLNDGVSADRLAFLIKTAEDDRRCEDIDSKRFLVRTPIVKGANTSVSYADEAIVVSAYGEPARNEAGQPLGWYDPAKPVRLEVARIDGEVTNSEGLLPQRQGTMHQGREYRFQLVATEGRGIVRVAAQVCELTPSAQ